MKLLKITLSCLLLGLASCSFEFKNDKKWRNDLAEETINGIKNPYMIDDFIYIYSASDKYAMNNDISPYDACTFRIYTLKDEITNINDISSYLKRTNDKSFNKLKVSVRGFSTNWMQLSELKPDYFKFISPQLRVELIKNNIENPDDYLYLRYKQCVDFFLDNKKAYKKDFVQKYQLGFTELYKTNDYKELYLKKDFNSVFTDKNTFVRVTRSTPNYNDVLFFNQKKQLLIELTQSNSNYLSANPSHIPQ